MIPFARLRSLAALAVAGVALSACAEMGVALPDDLAGPATRPTVSAPRAEPAAKPEQRKAAAARPTPKPERKPAEKKAAPEPAAVPQLVGLSEAETTRILGKPAEESEQPPGKVWVYKAAGCRLAVHLFPDMEKGGFYTLDTTAEEGQRDACVGKLAADARKND